MAGAGYKLFNTGDVLTAAQVNTYLQEQTVMVFADAAARTTALASVLAEGMVSYLKDTNATEVYDGSAWVGIGNSGDITNVGVTSPITGGGASGSVTIGIQDATTAQKGAVQLTDSTSSTSTTTAATPNSVKSSYDLANAAIPKSTVTANGDLIYGTGSAAVTRLGIGSNGNVLTVSSGVPAWSAPAGGGSFTKITTSSFSNVASVTIDNVFSSTYKSYLVVIDDVYAATGNDDLQMQLRYGTTTQTSGYYGNSLRNDYNASTFSRNSSVNSSEFFIHDYTGASGYPFVATFWIQQVGSGSSEQPAWHGTGYDGTNAVGVWFAGTGVAQAYTGFLLKSSSSNITGNVVVYGLGQ